MYPAHAANTFPVVRDQQKLGHISRGNNSIEMRTERCGCCQHMSVQIPQKDNFCKFSNKVLFCDQFLKSDKVKSTAYLSAVYVFHCSLTKEEVYEIALRHGTHKVRRWNKTKGHVNMCSRDRYGHSTGSIRSRLTLRRLMSYIYGAPILDVSRSHTTTQHSR